MNFEIEAFFKSFYRVIIIKNESKTAKTAISRAYKKVDILYIKGLSLSHQSQILKLVISLQSVLKNLLRIIFSGIFRRTLKKNASLRTKGAQKRMERKRDLNSSKNKIFFEAAQQSNDGKE